MWLFKGLNTSELLPRYRRFRGHGISYFVCFWPTCLGFEICFRYHRTQERIFLAAQ
jgi:hypothetical protein